jgi:hypothetical protein
MKIDWKNGACVLCSVGTGLCELLAHYQFTGGALPLHITAGALLLGANVFGLIGKSILTPGPVTVQQIVQTLEAPATDKELGARVAALPEVPKQ